MADTKQATPEHQIISVVIECGSRRFRAIENLRDLVGSGVDVDRAVSEARIGRKVLDLARRAEAGNE